MIKHVVSVFLAFALSLTAVFATNIYMQVDGIKGDSASDTHAQWIDVHSLQFGVARSCTSATAKADRECSTPTFSDITLTMPSGTATPNMYRAITGDPISKVVIDVTRSSKDSDDVYLQYTLTDAAVTGMSTSIDADGTAQDSISFSFGKITMEVFASKDTGNSDERNEFTYNVAAAKAE